MGELCFFGWAEDTNANRGLNSLSTCVFHPYSSSALLTNQLCIQPQMPVLSGFFEMCVFSATADITRSIGESVADNAFSASTASSFLLKGCTLMPRRNFRQWSVYSFKYIVCSLLMSAACA